MKCDIRSYFVTADGKMAGAARARFDCYTHGMHDFASLMEEGMRCPVGKIEQAVEDGLAKIAEAMKPRACVFEARPAGVTGVGRAWCQTHGFDCPNLLPGPRP